MKVTVIAFALLALTCPRLAPAAEKTPQPPPVAVYVFTATDPSGFIDADTKYRIEVVDSIKQFIADFEKKRFRVVGQRTEALIALEIGKGSTEVETDSLALLANAWNPRRPQQNTDQRVSYRHATLTIGDYSTDLRAKLGSTSGMVGQLKNWVKLNTEKVTALRDR